MTTLQKVVIAAAVGRANQELASASDWFVRETKTAFLFPVKQKVHGRAFSDPIKNGEHAEVLRTQGKYR